LRFYTRISSASFNSTLVSQVGVYNDKYIIGTSDRGLLVLSTSNTVNNSTGWFIINTIKNLNSVYPVSVADFVINQSTLYLLSAGQGLAVLDLNSNFGLVSFLLNHPSLTKLDFLNNPFSGSKYIGVGCQNGEKINEFFYEFLIDDEYNPQLNRIFTGSDLIISSNFKTVDMFFTYIFNKINNKLIIIRRGMLNNIPSELYHVDLSNTET
jgi:hypothetical protein